MSSLVTVQIPQTLYQRLEYMAMRLQKPVADMLVETLQAVLPPIDEVPEHIQAEMAALENLDVLELQEVAERQMAAEDQDALEYLLDLQGQRGLGHEEAARLDQLRMEYGRILLRKARAFALLAERGQPYPIE